MNYRLPVQMLAGLVLAAATSGCMGAGDAEVALGTLERDRLELTAEAHEPVLAIAVREGEHVRAGQELLRLDDATARAQLEQAGGLVDEARNRLAELVKGPRVEDILAARAALEGADSEAATEQSELQRVRSLVQQKLLSPADLDRQQAVRDAAAARQKQARAQLTELLRGTRIEVLDQARNAVTQAEGRLSELQVAAARLTVTAPADGIIEALPYEEGERPPAGGVVVVMLRDGAPYARVYVPEPLRHRVSAGTRAQVSADGIAEPLAGTVRYISAEAAFTPYYALTQRDRSRLSFLAEVTITDPAGASLPAGLPVEVRFPPTP